jgi:hypothetical protein
MKDTDQHIFYFSRRPSCLLLFCFFICVIARAQHGDTAISPVTDEDSAIAIEQADTNYEHENYFEHKTSDAAPDTVQLRQVPASVVDSLKKDDAFWYADHVFGKKAIKEEKLKDIKAPSQWMNMTTLVIIVVIFLAVLAWYLFRNNIISKKQTVFNERKEEISEENIFDIKYEKEIEKAIRASDYRLAIRLMYLRLLKDLSKKNIIQYKQERTNFDYLSQLYSTGYYNDFFRLTRNYEYAWYGKFDISTDAFSVIKNEFEKFDRRLS